MSSIAEALNGLEKPRPARRGPIPRCEGIYPPDPEDKAAIDAMRARGFAWAEIQQIVDEHLGVAGKLNLHRFKYHWRGHCSCWQRATDE